MSLDAKSLQNQSQGFKIYTSYFGNWRNFPEGSLEIAVTRFPPKGVVLNLRALAPSEDLLRQWKNKEIDEFVFKHKYITELEDRGLTPNGVKELFAGITEKRDIILCCYERPDEFCHRHILAEWLDDNVVEL